jgi:DNA polymerase-3 subunit alpha
MAFILVEDRLAEIEVLVFAKQYSKYAEDLTLENAVMIEGRLSVEEGDEAKIILSRLTPLLSNSEYASNGVEEQKVSASPQKASGNIQPAKLFIKLERMDDAKLIPLYRLANLNPGKTEIVIFDAYTKKYNVIKGTTISVSDKVFERLRSIYGESNVATR